VFRFARRHTAARAQARTAARPSCADESGTPDTPLLTELRAIQSHSRHLGWLSAREHQPDEYQELAGAIVAQVLQGWRTQTGGLGTLEDLLPTRSTSTAQLGLKPRLAAPRTCADVRVAAVAESAVHPRDTTRGTDR
jgi:hypothetical protein